MLDASAELKGSHICGVFVVVFAVVSTACSVVNIGLKTSVSD